MSALSAHDFTMAEPQKVDPAADDIAAALLLREVEKLLIEGQPRQAIAHIVDATGVERALAESFIAELKDRVFTGGQ